MTASRTRTTGAAGLLAVALLLPAGVVGAAGPETLVVAQDPFDVAAHDLAGDGIGHGDLYTWIAPATAEDGRTGTIVGEHQVVHMPTEGPYAEVRIGTSVLDLGDGDTVAFAGLVPVTTPLGQIEPGTELVNAIIGGTGAFGGAKGEIRSLRGEDGAWTHTLTYETAGPGGTEAAARYSVGPGAVREFVELTGDGTPGTGDFRTFRGSDTTDDGLTVDRNGLQTVIRSAGDDGSNAITLGFWMEVIGGDQVVAITAQEVTETGVAATDVTAALVGGTGRFAGARGSATLSRGDDGSFAKTFDLLDAPADTVERTLVLRSGLEAENAIEELLQQLDAVRPVDRGDAGASLGDHRSWMLPFVGDDGESGVAYGFDIVVKPASDEDPVRTVSGLTVIELSDGSTIVVSDLHREGAMADPAEAFVPRPVLGGTGRYAGVSGEIVTSFDGAGGLVHTLTLQGPAA